MMKRLSPEELMEALGAVVGRPVYYSGTGPKTAENVIIRELALTILKKWGGFTNPECARAIGRKSPNSVGYATQRCRAKFDEPIILLGRETTRREILEDVFWKLGEHEGWCVDFGKEMGRIKNGKQPPAAPRSCG